MKKIIILFFITINIFTIFASSKRFTIMCVGDSITEGSNEFSSYIYPLWEKLFSEGYEFEFIGPKVSPCRIGTLNCCGFSGKTVEYIDSKIDNIYKNYTSDIVLLHAG